MPNQSPYGDTVFLKDLQANTTPQKLTRVHFIKNRSENAEYDEAWLQNLIMMQPGLLSVGQIEPSFDSMLPVCTELPVQAGFVDNLLITPAGDITLVECKLWRNPEARRKVVAQIVDYASEVATWDYERLESAIRRAKIHDQHDGITAYNLFEAVAKNAGSDEASFHDAISRNLKHGRFLLLIVGDGIREGVETMAEFLQRHAGLHFRLAIIELALFKVPEGGFIAQPRTLAKAVTIERAVVTLLDERMSITMPMLKADKPIIQSTTMTQEDFLVQIEKTSTGLSKELVAFAQELEDYNVAPEYGAKTLILRWHAADGTAWNLATIASTGDIWMEYHGQQAQNLNMVEESKTYLERLAKLVPGASVRLTRNKTAWNISDVNGHSLRLGVILGDPARRTGWLTAIQNFQAAVAKSEE